MNWRAVKWIFVSCLAVGIAVVIAPPVEAQVDTGAILGTVKDRSGAVIPGARVTLTNEGTSFRVSTVTDQIGNYTFTPVQIGTYTVTASYRGFQKAVHTHVDVNIQQQVVVSFTLLPGEVTQIVQVTSATPLLQTQNASVGNVIGTRDVNDLPLAGRNYTFLAQLVAGVTKVQQNGRGLSASGSFNANGTQAAQNDYLLDGIDNNADQVDFLNGTAYVIRPPVDAIQEFKVQTSNFSAEFGRAAGAVINVSLKSGTNQLHGDAWEFLRNSGLDAADFFENAGNLKKGEFRQNQFGFTLGGPFVIPHVYHGKNKTFFFVDYDGMRIRQAQTFVGTVPTVIERASGFTDFADLISGQSGHRTDLLGRAFPSGTIFDPATTRPVTKGEVDPVTGMTAKGNGFVRDPFTGNIIPQTRLDGVGLKLASLYPAPTNGNLFNNFASNPVRKDNYNEFDVRVDHNFSDKDTMFARVSYNKEPQFLPTPFGGIADGLGNFNQGDQTTTSNGVALSETHSFSSAVVNEFRAGYSRLATYRVPPFGNQLGIPEQYGIPGVVQFSGNGGLPQFSIGSTNSLGTRGFLPTDEINPTWQLSENLTVIRGPHTLKMGAEVMHIKFYTLQPPYPKGLFDFNGVFTSIPGSTDGSTGRAQFLLAPAKATVPGGINFVGGPDSVNASNVNATDDRQSYLGTYIQDDWKTRPSLTLNLGIRWEYYQLPFERYGAQANFVPGAPGSTAKYLIPERRCGGPISPSFQSTLAASGILFACWGNPSLATSPSTNFGPRFGFAYQATSKLVLRGGYGIFYNGFQNLGYGPNIGGNYPFVFTFNETNPDPAHPIVYPNGSLGSLATGLTGFAFTPLAVNGKGLSFNGFQFNALTPSTQEWNVTLQSQFTPNQSVELAYVGNVSRHLYTIPGSNHPSEILPPNTSLPRFVPFPLLSIGPSYTTTQGNSNYNSVQASFERRFSGGLNFLADYTYSKCRTDARDTLIGDIGGYRAPYLANFGIQADYSLCDFDTPNMVHLSGGYTLPVGKGERFLRNTSAVSNAVLGGWRMNWILTLQDGNPFTVGCPLGTVTGMGCNALLVPGKDIYAGPHDVNQWLNPAAFTNPSAASSIGQSDYAPLGGAPTQAHGPGFHRLDFSLFKEIQTSERTHLEFRAEAFNLTNTPNFSLPGNLNFLNTKTFATSTSTVDAPYDSREIQFALKFYW